MEKAHLVRGYCGSLFEPVDRGACPCLTRFSRWSATFVSLAPRAWLCVSSFLSSHVVAALESLGKGRDEGDIIPFVLLPVWLGDFPNTSPHL